LVKAIDRHPFKSQIRHVDFIRVSLTEKVRAEVSLHFVGIPIGVKEGGILSPIRNSVEIEAFPAEIPPTIDVDVSLLRINDDLHVSDLMPMEGVLIIDDPSELLVTVTTAVIEVEPPKEPEVEGEVAGVEGAEEKTEEEASE
jgi:large subunit ribosomal protein L25